MKRYSRKEFLFVQYVKNVSTKEIKKKYTILIKAFVIRCNKRRQEKLYGEKKKKT